MSLTNRFQAALDNGRVLPKDVLAAPTLKNGVLEGALSADDLDLQSIDLEGESAEAEALNEPADLFAIDRAPETSEQRWRRIAGLEAMGGNGLWGERGRKAEDERKETEARNIATQRTMLNIQIQQQIDTVRREDERLLVEAREVKKQALEDAERSDEAVKKGNETKEKMLEKSLELSNGKRGFLSSDESYFVAEDGTRLTDPQLIAEAKQKKKQKPDSYDGEDYEKLVKNIKKAEQNAKDGRDSAEDMDEVGDHIKERGKKLDDLETRLKNGEKLTDKERMDMRREADRLIDEQKQDKAKITESKKQHEAVDEPIKAINEVSEKVAKQRRELTHNDTVKAEIKISKGDIDKASFFGISNDELAALKATKEARSTGTVAEKIDPIKLSENVPPVKTEFAKNAKGETVAVTETPKPSNDQPVQAAATSVVAQPTASAAPA